MSCALFCIHFPDHRASLHWEQKPLRRVIRFALNNTESHVISYTAIIKHAHHNFPCNESRVPVVVVVTLVLEVIEPMPHSGCVAGHSTNSFLNSCLPVGHALPPLRASRSTRFTCRDLYFSPPQHSDQGVCSNTQSSGKRRHTFSTSWSSSFLRLAKPVEASRPSAMMTLSSLLAISSSSVRSTLPNPTETTVTVWLRSGSVFKFCAS